jgi:hypothetical protein
MFSSLYVFHSSFHAPARTFGADAQGRPVDVAGYSICYAMRCPPSAWQSGQDAVLSLIYIRMRQLFVYLKLHIG